MQINLGLKKKKKKSTFGAVGTDACRAITPMLSCRLTKIGNISKITEWFEWMGFLNCIDIWVSYAQPMPNLLASKRILFLLNCAAVTCG